LAESPELDAVRGEKFFKSLLGERGDRPDLVLQLGNGRDVSGALALEISNLLLEMQVLFAKRVVGSAGAGAGGNENQEQRKIAQRSRRAQTSQRQINFNW